MLGHDEAQYCNECNKPPTRENDHVVPLRGAVWSSRVHSFRKQDGVPGVRQRTMG